MQYKYLTYVIYGTEKLFPCKISPTTLPHLKSKVSGFQKPLECAYSILHEHVIGKLHVCNPTIKIWISLLILTYSYINHIWFFILQNKGKYISNRYDWLFVISSVRFDPSISFWTVISNFQSSSVYSYLTFQFAVQKTMISSSSKQFYSSKSTCN